MRRMRIGKINSSNLDIELIPEVEAEKLIKLLQGSVPSSSDGELDYVIRSHDLLAILQCDIDVMDQ